MSTAPYRPALAAIHDAGFSDETTAAAPPLLRLLRSRGVRRGRVVDLGCGPGHWLAALSRAGYESWGIDASAAMIRLARRRAPRAGLIRADLSRAALPRCAALTALGEPLNYLAGPPEVRRLLARARAALEPGGLFIFDVRLPNPRLPRVSTVARVEERWAVFVEKRQNAGGTRLERRILSLTRKGRTWRPDEELHALRLYPMATLRSWLKIAGFRVETRGGYDRPLGPARAVFIASR